MGVYSYLFSYIPHSEKFPLSLSSIAYYRYAGSFGQTFE